MKNHLLKRKGNRSDLGQVVELYAREVSEDENFWRLGAATCIASNYSGIHCWDNA